MKNERAMYAISYGLFVLTARQGERDNGCIINTAVQVTAQPNRVTIAVNKGNLTHDMIQETGKFNLSVLSEEADSSCSSDLAFSPAGIATNLPGPKTRSGGGRTACSI